MGTVYLARDPLLRRLVAVKVLSPSLAGDEASRKRFIREAEAAAAVAHPNVVGVYQVGELPASGTTYFVMQYVDGPTLQAEFPEGVAVPEAQARRIVGEVATALAAAHARGLVHRDIKPANIMLDRESGRVVVLDFGISAILERRSAPGAEKLTAEGQSLGTPQYMSPEQAAARPVTDRSDVYSLGAVAFELATGRPPFRGETSWDLIAAHIKEAPPPVATLRPDLDPQFASLIDRCLLKDPVQRPSADEMARALLPAAHAVIEWPPPGLERLRGSGARLAAALGAMTAVGALFFVTLLSQPPLGEYAVRPGLLRGRMWLFALGAYLVTLALCAMAATVRALRLADHLKHGRRSAYPWLVLLDAAWDHSPHTGALLNGTGIFALVPPERRSRLLRLRRPQALLVALTLALGLLLPLLWTAGVIGGWAGDGTRLLPFLEFGVVLAPMFLCGAAALACAQPERLLLRRAEPDWRQRWRRRLVPVRSEVVDAWLHAFGGAGRSRGRLAYRVFVFGVPSLLAAALTIGLGAAAAAAFVADELRRSADPSEWLASLSSDSRSPLSWQSFDSLLAAVGDVRRASAQPDTAATQLLFALGWASGPLPAFLAVDSAALAALPAILPTCRGGVRLSRDTTRFAAATADTLTPWLEVWRRVARSAPIPNLAGLRAGIPGVRAIYPVFDAGLQEYLKTVTTLACLNMSAALIAQRRGDSAVALERLRENVAVGRHLLRSPWAYELLLGHRVLLGVGPSLRSIASQTHDERLAREADALREALRRIMSEGQALSRVLPALFANLDEPAGLRVVGDSTFVPALRVDGAHAGIVAGSCLNPREILFGVDARRTDLLRRGAAKLADIPRAGDVAALTPTPYLEQFFTNPSGVVAGLGMRVPLISRVFIGLGLGNFAYRLELCRNLGSWVWDFR
jgi:serine/threonine-protein kinase